MSAIRIKAVFFTGCCLRLVVIAVAAAAQAQTGDQAGVCSSPDAILNRYREAVGGAAAIQRLETRIADATETEPYNFKPQETATYKYRFAWKAPNQVSARFTHIVRMLGAPVPFAKANFIFDGELWSDYRGRFFTKKNESPFRKRLVFDYPQNAMWRVAADPLMIARDAKFYSGSTVVNDSSSPPGLCVLEARGVDGRVDFLYFELATGFLRAWRLQMVQPRNSFYILFRFDDYRQAGEIKFPFYLYCDYYKATFRYTKLTHNQALPDGLFVIRRDRD